MSRREIVKVQFHTTEIRKNVANGYFCITDAVQAQGRNVHDYLRLDSTNEYLTALNADTAIPLTARNQGFQGLVCIFQGGNDHDFQGTWIHPEVLVDFLSWCNVDFRIWANRTLVQVINHGYYHTEEHKKILRDNYRILKPLLASIVADSTKHHKDFVLLAQRINLFLSQIDDSKTLKQYKEKISELQEFLKYDEYIHAQFLTSDECWLDYKLRLEMETMLTPLSHLLTDLCFPNGTNWSYAPSDRTLAGLDFDSSTLETRQQ
jgi:KilA-N domain